MELLLEEELNTVANVKQFIGKLKADMKETKLTNMKKVFLSELLDGESALKYVSMQYSEFYPRRDKEIERAKEFNEDIKEREKAGFFYEGNKKNILAENKVKQMAWAEKAFPKVEDALWDSEMDLQYAIGFLKSGNLREEA